MDGASQDGAIYGGSRGPSVAICLAALVWLGGCERYQPLALDDSSVQRSLVVPPADVLRMRVEGLRHPIVRPLKLDLRDGLSPDEAALLAVVINPSLRAARDKRGVAAAQLVQAGLLPNPQMAYSSDFPTAGATTGTVDAFGLGLNWDVTELIAHSAQVDAASQQRASVDLDVAWQEWQAAQAAKMAVYDLVSLSGQAAFAASSDRRLGDNYKTVQKAVESGLMTALDLSAAETASRMAHATVLDLRKKIAEQRLKLNTALGVPVDANVTLESDLAMPGQMEAPGLDQLVDGLQERRLDLVALRRGYDSQQETLRAAILNQFPRINIGGNQARDTGDVVTTGFSLTIDLPLFDRNQGRIALERATRQRLFDEYADRVFQARADIGRLLARIPLINEEIETAEATERSGRRLVDTYRRAVDEGQADVLSYYTAWSDLTQTQMRVLQLKQQLVDTRIALELACGLYELPKANATGPSDGPMYRAPR